MTIIAYPEHIEHVQKTAFDQFIKGDIPRGLFGDFIGTSSIFLADGEAWRAQRKLAKWAGHSLREVSRLSDESCSHVFKVGKVDEYSETVIVAELELLSRLLGSIADAEAFVDLQDVRIRRHREHPL